MNKKTQVKSAFIKVLPLTFIVIMIIALPLLLSIQGEADAIIPSDKLLFEDKVVNDTSLMKAFNTTNTTNIENKIFTELKINDANLKEAVFTMNSTKLTAEDNLSIVFNEVCGKVNSYELYVIETTCIIQKNNSVSCSDEEIPYNGLVDVKKIKIKGDIEPSRCLIGGVNYSYAIEWKPILSIGINVLVVDKWAWWNVTSGINETYTGLDYGLIQYYTCDDDKTSGTISVDSMNYKNGTLTGGLTSGFGGILGQAYNDDAEAEYLNVRVPNVTGASSMSINLWVNKTGNGGAGYGRLFHDGGNSVSCYSEATQGFGDLIDVVIDTSGTNCGARRPYVHFVNNTWVMLTFVYNGSQMNVYVNGTFVYNSTCSGTVVAYTKLQIMSKGTTSEGLYGSFDEIGFWNRSLNSTEISQLYNNGFGLSYRNYTVDSVAPSVIVNSPPDFNWTNDDTPSINFTATDDKNNSMRCDLTMNNTLYGFNASTLNNTATIITANASLSFFNVYNYWINCTDGTNMNKSTSRTLYLYNCTGTGGACSAGCLTFSPGCYAIAATGCDYVTT